MQELLLFGGLGGPHHLGAGLKVHVDQYVTELLALFAEFILCDELGSEHTAIVLNIEIVIIPGGEPHQIEYILPLVASEYALNLIAASNPLPLLPAIQKLHIAIQAQFTTNLHHK